MLAPYHAHAEYSESMPPVMIALLSAAGSATMGSGRNEIAAGSIE